MDYSAMSLEELKRGAADKGPAGQPYRNELLRRMAAGNPDLPVPGSPGTGLRTTTPKVGGGGTMPTSLYTSDGGAGGGDGWTGKVGGFLKNNWKDVLGYGLAAAELYSGAKKQGEANDLQQQAIELALLDRAERAPLREAFIPNATKPLASAPDLSYTRDTGNPFSRSFIPPAGTSPHVASQLFSEQTAAGPQTEAERRAAHRALADGIFADRKLQAQIQSAPRALPSAPPPPAPATVPTGVQRALMRRRAV